MVRLLVALVLAFPAVSLALDEDELRDLLAPAEAEHAARDSRAKVSDGLKVKPRRRTALGPAVFGAPVPDEPAPPSPSPSAPVVPMPASASQAPSEPPRAAPTPHVNKYGRGGENSPVEASAAAGASGRPAQASKSRPSDPDIYIPPPRLQTTKSSRTVVYGEERKDFGIVLGTWMAAKLVRPVTSADNAATEVILTEDVEGRRRVLPAGTTLFGDKRFNSASERLEVVFTRGITPDGQEFSLVASLYDSRKLSGLSGAVVRRREEEVAVAAQKGALTAAGGIIGSTVDPTGGAIARGVADAGSELLDNERRYIRQPQAFIQVSPQDVLVRVDQSF